MHRYLLKNKKMIAVYCAAAIIAAGMGTGFSFVLSHMMNLAQNGTNRQILYFSIISCLYVCLTVLMELVYTLIKYRVLMTGTADLKRDLFYQITNIGVIQFEQKNSSFYLNELTTKSDMFSNLFFKNILGIPYFLFSFCSAVAACIYLNPLMLGVMLIFGLLTVYMTQKSGKMIESTSTALARELPVYTAKLKDYFEGFKLIRVFQTEDLLRSEHDRYNLRLELKKYQNMKHMIIANSCGELVGLISTIVVTGIAVFLALNGYITIGAVLAFSQLMGKITTPISCFVDMQIGLKAIKPIKEEFEEILQKKMETEECEVNPSSGDIELKKVSFRYLEDQNLVLKNVNVRFKKNKKYLIIGDSGSGKSTLLSLILGFYEPTEGMILWGDRELKSNHINSLYSHIGYMTQSPFLFEDTIKNNICLYQNYSEAEISRVIKTVGLQELIDTLPEGINSILNEAGRNLSGGEKQRICLARVLLADKEILLLDEFESGLDHGTRERIENIILSMQNKLILTVSHDISVAHRREYDIMSASESKGACSLLTSGELDHKPAYDIVLRIRNGILEQL